MRNYHTDDELAYRRQKRAWEQDQKNQKLKKVLAYGVCVGAALVIVLVASCEAQAAYQPPYPWLQLADCESGDGDGLPPYTASWHYNGYFDGGLQFLPSTWQAAIRLTPGWQPRFAYRASARTQVRVAQRWLRATSWAQWPVCSRKLGLR